MDEAALAGAIRAAQRGEPKGFDALVSAYASRVFGFAYRLMGSREDAEDVMQEVFLRVVRTIRTYEHDGRFDAWIFRIAANLVRDRARRVRRSPRLAGAATDSEGNGRTADGSLPIGPGESPPVESRLVLREEVDALNAALARLPAPEREAVMLRHFSQMSFKEIAAVMETPLGTALARVHRGLMRLREMMAGPRAGATAAGDRSKPSQGVCRGA